MRRSAALTISLGLLAFVLGGCAHSPEHHDPASDKLQPADGDFKGRAPSKNKKERHPLMLSADMTSFSLLTKRTSGRDLHPYVHVAGDGMPSKIYFASDSDGSGFDIYEKHPVGSAIMKVTSLSGNELWPTVSSNGRWMAFGSDMKGNFDIFVMDLMNPRSAPVNVTMGHPNNDIHPTWSPNGQRLVYASYSPTKGSYVLKYVDLSAGGGAMSYAETGGSMLAFSELEGSLSDPKADDKPMAMTNSADLMVTGRGTLSSNQGRTITGIHPDFRPTGNGQELVYQDYVRAGKGWNTIKLFNIGTGFISQIPLTEEYGAIQPRWSPNGRKIIFATVAKSSNKMDEKPVGADGFAITDPAGSMVQDLRNPTDRGQVSDPFWVNVMGENRLYFSAAQGESEVIASIRLTDGR